LKGRESKDQIKKIISSLEQLYVEAFKEFDKILNSNGVVVIIFPVFIKNEEELKLDINDQINKIGFHHRNKDILIYKRKDQYIWRQIHTFIRNSVWVGNSRYCKEY